MFKYLSMHKIIKYKHLNTICHVAAEKYRLKMFCYVKLSFDLKQTKKVHTSILLQG